METGSNPRKNLMISGFVALLIVAVGIYVNRDEIVKPKFATSEKTNTQKTTKAGEDDITKRDSDEDGLLDWEERLRGTDPFNPDTDGDGTFDGKELALGRDPLKPAPNDLLPLLTQGVFATSSTDLEGIRKEFFAKYLTDAGRDIRETTFRDIIGGFNPKRFKPTNQLLDLNISSDADGEALRAYGNAFGKLIQKHTSTPLRTEEEIFNVAMKTKNDASLRDLQLLVVVYNNFSRDLRSLTVPLPLAEHHLAIVNGYDGMAKGLSGMMQLYSKPIEGAAGYQTYTRMRLDVTVGYAGVVAYFIEKKVTFDETEPGYPFYYNTTKLLKNKNEVLL